MPGVNITIDGRSVHADSGSTILSAAGALGIEIPTMCFLRGLEPCTSCFVCVVKLQGRENFVPACATKVSEGMVVETATPDVLAARRTALELLLSDHVGDCEAPCRLACPGGIDIPAMIRQIARGDTRGALETLRVEVALPGVLGRICHAPCEKACRRGLHDAPLAICPLHRFAAKTSQPPMALAPPLKNVVVIGAGPAGLSAAYHLLRSGYACTILEQAHQPGGSLRNIEPSRLPKDLLDAEIALLDTLGLQLQLGVRAGKDISLETLRGQYDVVVVTTGAERSDELGLARGEHGLAVDAQTLATARLGIFAGGDAIRLATPSPIRAMADGKRLAACVRQFLSGQIISPPHRPFNVHMGHLHEGEMATFLASCPDTGQTLRCRESDLSDAQAQAEAARCLHCDCRKATACRLRLYAQQVQAGPSRFAAPRRDLQQDISHELVIYEPTKCIACGLCVQIARRAGEKLGMTFIGRGFDVRIGVPFAGQIRQGLALAAEECVNACPTGALAKKP